MSTAHPPGLAAPRAVRADAVVFAAFAFAYLFSALLRAVTATLAPVFSTELGLGAGQLGLLAGVYFLGFALMQLPLGSALDRIGPRRVLLAFLSVAVLGCLAFARADSLGALLAARFLIGVGVSACLMAPLTCYRRLFSPAAQLRANSWMLMTGSLGMLASTLPVQWLLPSLGWRGLFGAVAGLLVLAMVGIHCWVPADAPLAAPAGQQPPGTAADGGYRAVFRHPVFLCLAPLGLVSYGGLIALQALWIGPWLTRVAGWSAQAAAGGLFVVNLSMLLAFLAWGLAMPWLMARGWAGERLIAWAWPSGLACLLLILVLGPAAGAPWWALWCVCTSVVSLSQPAVGQAFAPGLAGRALSAFNLMIFAGVFLLQWGIGLLIDAAQAAGAQPLAAFRGALGAYALAGLLAYGWFLHRRRGWSGVVPMPPGP